MSELKKKKIWQKIEINRNLLFVPSVHKAYANVNEFIEAVSLQMRTEILQRIKEFEEKLGVKVEDMKVDPVSWGTTHISLRFLALETDAQAEWRIKGEEEARKRLLDRKNKLEEELERVNEALADVANQPETDV